MAFLAFSSFLDFFGVFGEMASGKIQKMQGKNAGNK
jgi:hypothetical protein